MIKNKLKPLVLFALALMWGGITQAQESVNSTGGDAIGSGGKVSFSVGQIAVTTNSGTTGSVAQGVQHAYEIFTIGFNETALNISLNIFPNPTADNLTLQISDYNNEMLSYQLFDMYGVLLNDGPISAQQTKVNMNGLPTATYFINIVDKENKKVQSFKVIKSN